MSPNTRITKVSLMNFRNHLNTTLNDLGTFVVLNGKNGSGKTNILEAISLFSPGRGFKNAQFIDIIPKSQKVLSFQIKIVVAYDSGEIEIKRNFSLDKKNKNLVFVDNEKIANSQLLDFLNIIWITPIMEKVLLQSNTEKRNFFDRLIFNINKDHLKNHSKLQKLLKERLFLLRSNKYDENWLNIIEDKIVNLSLIIFNDRKIFFSQLNKRLKKTKILSNACEINVNHEISKIECNQKSKSLYEKYKFVLTKNRKLDAELNRTSLSINKVKIDIYNNSKKNIEAKECSTGEQKSIILSIFLSVAKMVKEKNNDRSPIILIDEAMAHLDSDHKEFLFSELSNLNSQVWFSGVTKDLFESINHQTDFFEMKNIV